MGGTRVSFGATDPLQIVWRIDIEEKAAVFERDLHDLLGARLQDRSSSTVSVQIQDPSEEGVGPEHRVASSSTFVCRE